MTPQNQPDKEIQKLQTPQELLDYLQAKWVVISEATKNTILHWKNAMISDEELERRREAWELSGDYD